ncbi:hypothetical protein CHS0354_000706 [Potamilus streckersoni]|uniref:3-isopropylmalate dehydrogenase n=1 Tax=Potamilus streckersoni TaxID=2493646 RepID=A0AAE0W9C8_9BIVA|nr:hypothetical protein CHS0354_000706 [Potamilus streckersoni]
MNANIAVLEGDGIGPEVTAQSIKVLQAIGKRFGHQFMFVNGLVGAAAIRQVSDPFPEATETLCRRSDAILFGAVGDPEFDSNPKAKIRPEQGLLRMRQVLGLYNNIRPIMTFSEILEASPLKRERIEGVDFIVVRELTGGIYFGKPQGRSENGELAFDSCAYSKYEIARSLIYAFTLAQKRQKRLTVVDKANVLATSRLWREVAHDMSKNYAEVELSFLFVDNAAMQLILNPKQFDVIVTENMFGDILTDEASVITGSLGILPSASIGDSLALYEPIHGSYPQASGKNIANPLGSILSAEMMLSYSFNLMKEAACVRAGVQASLKAGKTTADINASKPVGTSEVGDFISNYILNSLFTPGPTPVPERVTLKMSEPIIHHRNPEFVEILTRVHQSLKYLFRTNRPVVVFTCSGTGGVEATMVSMFSYGDKIIAVNGGKFGERWFDMAKKYTGNAVEVKVEWGKSIQPEEMKKVLEAHPDAKGVYFTHSETSTGTATDVKAISEIIQKHSSALVCVDGITAIGAHEFHFDEWGVDVCVTGSQKGLMMPPGLALVAVSEQAEKAMEKATLPAYYLSLKKAIKAQAKEDTPFTPAVTLIIGLDEALQMIKVEGIENVWKRHQRLAHACRTGCEALGMKLFSNSPSLAVTPVWLPSGVEWKSFNKILKQDMGITVAAGQDDFLGKIFRISHLGFYDELDMLTVVGALEFTLKKINHPFTVGSGVAAVQKAFLN